MTLLFLPTFYLMIDGNPEKRAARKKRRMDKRDKAVEKRNTENLLHEGEDRENAAQGSLVEDVELVNK